MARFAKWQIRYTPSNSLFAQRFSAAVFLFATVFFIAMGIITETGWHFVCAAIWFAGAFSRMLIAGFQELIEKEYK